MHRDCIPTATIIGCPRHPRDRGSERTLIDLTEMPSTERLHRVRKEGRVIRVFKEVLGQQYAIRLLALSLSVNVKNDRALKVFKEVLVQVYVEELL